MTTLKFCGAAGTVTGSCSFINTGKHRFVIDCGLFQGNKTTQALNYEEFPFDPTKVDFLILTHAHIDHSGLLPKLVKAGFSGEILCTEATSDLLEFMLRDSAYIQESNVERYNRKIQRRGLEPVEAIYTIADAENTLRLLEPQKYEEWFSPRPGVKVRFWNAGHLLGSASIELIVDDDLTGKSLRLLFSGDLGPEGLLFISAEDSPTDEPLLVVGNEVSGSTTVYRVNL